MEYVLVIFSANYCDEFDIFGFGVYKKPEWNNLKKKFKSAKKKTRWQFGTNQFFEIDELKDNWLSNFEEEDITEVEYLLFKNRLAIPKFGIFFDIEEYLEENK